MSALAACDQPNPGAKRVAHSEGATEPRGVVKAVAQGIDRRPPDPMNKIHDYKYESPDSERPHWIILSDSAEAKKSREIFEKEISNGNYSFQYRMISEYISLSKDKNIPKNIRRKYLIDALWLWQRLPPLKTRWIITSDKLPKNLSEDLDSQGTMQDLIVRLHVLEQE